MDTTNSQASSSEICNHKSLQEIVKELTTPEKILIQFTGWKNVCQTLEYIFENCSDLFDGLSGISFDYDGLAQVVGNVCSAANLKEKVLLGETYRTTTYSYKLDNERDVELLQGFDDLDRNLKKFSIWGCNFVILQVKLACTNPFGAIRVPFDNSEYFGIFSSTTQALGMVPIIQFQYDPSCSEDDRAKAFVDAMFTINHSLFEFDVDTSCLLISPFVSYPLEAGKDVLLQKAESLINSLKQALPPVIGGVIVTSEGRYKEHALHIDQLSKIIDRIPWPITCCYEWKIPTIPESDTRYLTLKKWVNRQGLVIKILLLASKSNLIFWKGKLTLAQPDFISTHDYFDMEYMLHHAA